MRAFCLAGPTASGKTQAALWLAQEVYGALINTDSVQVYRDLPLLTARPTLAQEALCPHFLYAVLGPTQAFSVARWLAEVARVLLLLEGKAPIFVGGTGLYFKALLEGLSPIPEVKREIREHLRRRVEMEGFEALKQAWPLEAGHLPQDPQRALRALEVFLSTGKPLVFWQAQKAAPLIERGACVSVLLMPPKEVLQARARTRLEEAFPSSLSQMHALLESVPGLEKAPLMQALGARELVEVCRGKCSAQEALERALARTRQYIKRQRTWFRHQMPWAYVIEEPDFSGQKEHLKEILAQGAMSL